ncbi:MAG: 2-oxoacid:ferredoxin oxidoreductase subunit beta, partial [Casimicrobiaceae bacterium]
NSDEPIDLALLALTLGASFVARGFSGDKEQLIPLIKAAVAHHGAAFIDVVSPCVAFNNHPGSTKSYDYVREHNEAVNRLDFISSRAEIKTSYAPGEVRTVAMHDGGAIRLRKLNDDYDAADRVAAMAFLESRRAAGEVVTGLLYLHEDGGDMHDALDTIAAPLNSLTDAELVPGNAALAAVNASLR